MRRATPATATTTSDLAAAHADTIESPATAKNVITVGAIQELRNITNVVTTVDSDGTTNTSPPWQAETSTGYRVAGFSSRGNVGIGIEGTFGRYKPDVVRAGHVHRFHPLRAMGHRNVFLSKPDEQPVQTFTGLIVQPGSICCQSVSHVFPPMRCS